MGMFQVEVVIRRTDRDGEQANVHLGHYRAEDMADMRQRIEKLNDVLLVDEIAMAEEGEAR